MSIINLIIERETPQGNLGIGGTGDRSCQYSASVTCVGMNRSL